MLQLLKCEGHVVGNHTYSHRPAYSVTPSFYSSDVNRADSILHTDLFRCPNGCITFPHYWKIAKQYTLVYWSLQSRDSSLKPLSETEIYDDVMHLQNNTKRGDIILFHFSNELSNNTCKILPLYLRWLYDNHYVSQGLPHKYID